jgi:hypothetical protein
MHCFNHFVTIQWHRPRNMIIGRDRPCTARCLQLGIHVQIAQLFIAGGGGFISWPIGHLLSKRCYQAQGAGTRNARRSFFFFPRNFDNNSAA